MRRCLGMLVAVLLAAATAATAGPVERTFNAPVERVWAVTEAVLKHLGWDLDKTDRAIGFITTDSRRVDGDNFGVYEKATRHRLRLHVKAAGERRTTVSVERSLFKRERILFVDKDEPVAASDQNVEKAVLDAIGKAL
ncbi:MAG TPA: hypothetical protein VGD07_22890 [Methylomirabilota bacterium]